MIYKQCSSSSFLESRRVLKPDLLHFLFPKIPQLLEDTDTFPFGDGQILCVFRVQLDSVVTQDYRLAEARQHQHEETLALRLVEPEDAFPARQHRPAYLDRVGVLDHQVHDGDGQLVNKVASVRVPKVQDARYLVVSVLALLHQNVEVIEVAVIYA